MTAAAPAQAATPGSTSSTAAGCAPYLPTVNLLNAGYFCQDKVAEGMTFEHPGFCTNAGFAARSTISDPNKPYYACVAFGNAVKGDLFGGWQDSGQTIAGSQICAANNMTFAKKVTVNTGEYVVCDGTPSKTVSDAKAQEKLDTIAAKITATAASSTSADPRMNDVVSLLWVIVSVGALAVVLVLFLGGVHVTGRMLS